MLWKQNQSTREISYFSFAFFINQRRLPRRGNVPLKSKKRKEKSIKELDSIRVYSTPGRLCVVVYLLVFAVCVFAIDESCISSRRVFFSLRYIYCGLTDAGHKIMRPRKSGAIKGPMLSEIVLIAFPFPGRGLSPVAWAVKHDVSR